MLGHYRIFNFLSPRWSVTRPRGARRGSSSRRSRSPQRSSFLPHATSMTSCSIRDPGDLAGETNAARMTKTPVRKQPRVSRLHLVSRFAQQMDLLARFPK